MEFCNSTVTPCPKWRLTSDMCPSSDTERQNTSCLPYCAVVEKCMYLSTCTRPDISYAVCELAWFMSNYSEKHFEAAKHLLCYLQGTRSHGLVYGNTQALTQSSACSRIRTGPCQKAVAPCPGLSLNAEVRPLLGAQSNKQLSHSPHVRWSTSHARIVRVTSFGSDPFSRSSGSIRNNPPCCIVITKGPSRARTTLTHILR